LDEGEGIGREFVVAGGDTPRLRFESLNHVEPTPSTGKPDHPHFRDYPLTGHDADMPKPTRMTHIGLGAVEATSVYQRNTPVTRNSAHTVEFVRDGG
jgi:hypothetical protein